MEKVYKSGSFVKKMSRDESPQSTQSYKSNPKASIKASQNRMYTPLEGIKSNGNLDVESVKILNSKERRQNLSPDSNKLYVTQSRQKHQESFPKLPITHTDLGLQIKTIRSKKESKKESDKMSQWNTAKSK